MKFIAFRLARSHLYGILSWAITSNSKWSNDIVFCQTKTVWNKHGYKIQSRARVPNKAVRAEMLLFLYCVWTTTDSKPCNKPQPGILCLASQKSTQCYTVNMKITAMLSRSFYQLPTVYISFQSTCMAAKSAASFQPHSPSSSLEINTVATQGNLMNAGKTTVCLCRQ